MQSFWQIVTWWLWNSYFIQMHYFLDNIGKFLSTIILAPPLCLWCCWVLFIYRVCHFWPVFFPSWNRDCGPCCMTGESTVKSTVALAKGPVPCPGCTEWFIISSSSRFNAHPLTSADTKYPHGAHMHAGKMQIKWINLKIILLAPCLQHWVQNGVW